MSEHHVTVTGKVVNGRGRAAERLKPQEVMMQHLLKAPAAPGTLNVLLDRPILLNEGAIVARAGPMSFWPVELNCIPSLAYRWPRTPLHVVEIISATHFRKTSGLEAGDRVTLSFTQPTLCDLPLRARLAWAVLWLWRKQLIYSSDRYPRFLRQRLYHRSSWLAMSSQPLPPPKS